MKRIYIADSTLCLEERKYTFKEKLEIARQLERLCVDCIELPEVTDSKTDELLVRTISAFVKESVISVAAGSTQESIDNALSALSHAEKPRIRIELPVSPVGMEYIAKRKPQQMLEWISEAVAYAREKCGEVEFCAVDATRAEKGFLPDALKAAYDAGATEISVCDSASGLLPDDFAAFVRDIACDLPLGVRCGNKNGLAAASAILAVKSGADTVKTSVGGDTVPLDVFAGLLHNLGNQYGFSCHIRFTELNRIIRQISRIADGADSGRKAVPSILSEESGILLDASDDRKTVAAAVMKLGYDLNDEDSEKVFEEFRRVAEKKNMGAKELEAIIASVSLQVPPTYRLENYVINNGNIISSSAQITLSRDGNIRQGICIGDGPIDAAFRAIEQITGTHYELDDFQIQSVTEGKEAVGSAIVKLRFGGKLYSGNGVSTDIIGAGIRAYLAAVNKIVYEEA